MEVLETGVPAPHRASSITARRYLAMTLSVLGAFAEGQHHGEEVLRLATLEGRGLSSIIAHGCLD